MTRNRILAAGLGLAAAFATVEVDGADWTWFETAAGVRAGDGSSVYVAFLPTRQCRPRVSVVVGSTKAEDPPPGYHDVTDLQVTLQIDEHPRWRADWASIYEVDGTLRVAIDGLHPDLIAELAAGRRLYLAHTSATLSGAGEALSAARDACRSALEEPLAQRLALSH